MIMYFEEAVELIRGAETVSISQLQRKFRIGYNRAATIVGVARPTTERTDAAKVIIFFMKYLLSMYTFTDFIILNYYENIKTNFHWLFYFYSHNHKIIYKDKQ